MSDAPPDLTIAIPVKDGAAFLNETLDQTFAFALEFARPYEVIVVDDGSRDATAEILETRSRRDAALRVLTHERNRGKGAALKSAAAAARGTLLVTFDADASYSLSTAHECIAAIEAGADAAIGNRRDPRTQFVLHPRQFPYIGLRHFVSGIFNRLARLLTRVQVEDVQCGFKCYRSELARRFFPLVEDDRFAFDVELIALMRQQDCKITELPVIYTNSAQPTTVRLIRDGAQMIARMLRISAKLRRFKRSGEFFDPTRADYQDLARREGNPVQRFWHAQKWPLVERTLDLQGNQRILDVGAGSSEVAHRSCERGSATTAVDVSLPVLQFLRDRASTTESSLRCVGASILELPFESHSFDRVTVLEVIEHLPPEATADYLGELRRVIAPGGRLLVTTPNYRSYWPILESFIDRFGGVAEMGGVQHVSRFHARSLRGALDKAGFRVLKLGSVYHLSPFVAPFATRLAPRIFDWEFRSGGRLGPILFAIAEPRTV